MGDLAPEADRIVPLVAAAGMMGMDRQQLGNAVDLERDVLDELLAGMIRVGVLTLAWEDGVQVFRSGVDLSQG